MKSSTIFTRERRYCSSAS